MLMLKVPLATAIEQVAESVVITDAQAKILYVNQAFSRMTGYAREEVLGSSPRLLKSDQQDPAFYRDLWKTITAGQIWHGELINRRKDGSLYTEEMSITPVREGGGAVTHYIAIKQDVTARRAAEDAQQLLAAIVESSEDAIIGHAPDGVIVTWNRGAERLFGYRAEEVIGKSAALILPPDKADLFPRVTERLKRGETISQWEVECVGKHKDGIEVSLSLSPIPNAAGQLAAVSAIARDVAATKKAEHDLRASEKRYRLLFERNQAGILCTTPQGRILDCNGALATMLGYDSPADLLGRNATDFYCRSEARKHMLHELMSQNALTNLEVELRRKDDSRFWVIANMTVVEHDSDAVVIESTLLDITYRKRVEAQLREAKEAAEAASQTKSEFLANMSHEIRTPMNGVIGMTELLLDTPLTPEQREYLSIVAASGRSLLAIINDVLDFSKIEAHKLDLHNSSFDLRSNIDTTLQEFRLRAAQKELRLACHIEPDVPARVVGDPVRIRQILVNLVGNAIKFTGHGGVTVRVSRVGQAEGSIDLQLSVSDTGMGIAPEKQKVIFDPFTQADNSTTRQFGGTGLGLAITVQLVGLMGGTVRLESEVGKGSTFHVTVRLGAAEPEVEAPPPTSPPPRESSATLHCLVVEDNPVNQLLAVRLLQKHGHSAAVAGTGLAALAALERERFDVVLMDVQMPEMDGFETTRAIRKKERQSGAHLPIIAMTAHAMERDRQRCLEAGMDWYVAKPIDAREFLAAVARVAPAAIHPIAPDPSLRPQL
jgi:two-component system sensor histidine kinase/response regulator